MFGFGKSPDSETEKRLSERVADLEKRMDSVEMEWSEWFDKFRRLYARLAKRQEREEKTDADGPGRPQEARTDARAPLTPAAGMRRNLRGF